MAKKFYAVKVGKTPGIYNTWDDCKVQVEGVSGATYKSFATAEEACAYMGWSNVPENREAAFGNAGADQGFFVNSGAKDNSDNPLSLLSPGEAIAYVDGSYNDATKQFSYGIVFFSEGVESHFSKCVEDESLVSMRNVAGEIKGAEAAMRYAIEKGCKSLAIYHDYEGIAKWCLGEWKTNKEGTIAYKKYYDSIKDKIDIRFVKVKGHSNDKYNDLADKLAKEAIGIGMAQFVQLEFDEGV